MRKNAIQAIRMFREDGATDVCSALSRYINRVYYTNLKGTEYNVDGTLILEEDWDNLIILDACRFDYFERFCDIEGTLEYRISRGSTSKQFIWGNFIGRREYDTVYLSDNPWYGKLYDTIGSELYHFSFCERDAFDGIVSYPSTVTESAVEYNNAHDRKRLIVHYLQPHAPYFTQDGKERFRWPDEEDPELIREAYTDNLELVLSEVETLLEALEGKTVITSDHGELLGERLLPCPLRQYQHPRGIYVEELVKVPWLVIENDERKEITAEDRPKRWTFEDTERDRIDDQLKGLGYL